MERLRGTTWFTQWFVLKGGMLYWFGEQLDKFPQGEIPLSGALVEEDQMVKRPFAIHLFVPNTKRHYCLVPNSAEDFTNWMGALRKSSNGQGGSPAPMSRPQGSTVSYSPGFSQESNNRPPPSSFNNPGYNNPNSGYNNPGYNSNKSSIPNPGFRTGQDSYPSPGSPVSSRGPPRGGPTSRDDSMVSYDPRGKEFNPPNVKPSGPTPGGPQSRDDSALPRNNGNAYNNGGGNRANDRANWEQHETNDGYMYYWNRVTGESSWDCPY